jgi:hypothetical protein
MGIGRVRGAVMAANWRLTLGMAVVLGLAGAVHAAEAPAQAPPSPPPSWFDRWLNPETAPFIPIPEIDTNPNSGTTIGLLGVFLETDEKNEIRRIFAPDVIYNGDLGAGGRFRFFDYPSTDAESHLVVGGKQKIERELDAVYATGLSRERPLTFNSRLVYDRSATERFFGLGNKTDHGAVTNYTAERAYLDIRAGWNVDRELQLAYEIRPRNFQVQRGTLPGLPSIETRFAGVAGNGGDHDVLNSWSIAYDTRDSIITPSRGGQLVGFAAIADRAFLSSVSYTQFGLDGRYFTPVGERHVLALHAAAQYMPVDASVPFWALSSLGGDRSVLGERQPLRGFGNDRFIDRNLFSASAEFRARVADLNMFSTQLGIEVAPFVDVGRVFHELGDDPFRGLHRAAGIGFRAIAEPFIVGYVDIGIGGNGVAIFSGINYPF